MNTNQDAENKTKYMSFQLDLTALNGRGMIFAALPIDIAANAMRRLGCRMSAIAIGNWGAIRARL